jgi:NADH-quinone oxidoreductase subunit J
MSGILLTLCLLCALCSVILLQAKKAITAALALLGVLLMTAGIYGVIGEHFIATIQLVVYAGAIMVLFIFSIMLLNLKEEVEIKKGVEILTPTILLCGLVTFILIGLALHHHFTVQDLAAIKQGPFTQELVKELGGNSKVLAHALFSQYYLSFEVISLALLTALVGAVVLAKRHID